MSAGPAFQTQEQATDREEAAPVNDKEPAETSVANDTSFPWLELLQSDFGAKTVDRIVNTWAENSKRANERESTVVWIRYTLVFFIIALAGGLQACDKLTEGVIGLLSLVVGYIIGRQDAK